MNLRPPDYEPDELPAAPPRDNNNTSTTNLIILAEVINFKEDEGFEPPRAIKRLSVFKTDPFSRTWVILHKY